MKQRQSRTRPGRFRPLAAAIALATAPATPPAVAQDMVVSIEPPGGGQASGARVFQPIRFVKRMDKSTPLLQDEIASAFSANKVDPSQADLDAVAQAAAAQWDKWFDDFVINGKCSPSRAVRGTAPSGGFVYVIECSNCRPRTC